MKIGVFDSGVGGLSVVRAVEQALPDDEVVYREDRANVPYGDKSADQLLALTLPILQDMQNEGCEVIVIACNTVTTTIIDVLRTKLTVPLVGMEPMVKPAAAASKTGVIAVCATPGTLRSDRYAWLKDTYAKGVQVIEPDCSDWSSMIENDQVDEAKISDSITAALDAGADQIVLGCTHYHWIEELISRLSDGRATVLQPEQPAIEQLKRVLEQRR